MTRMELPTTTGDYNVDGISIIILPNKIIVDTGNRQTVSQGAHQNSSAYAGKKKGNGESKKPKKDGDMWNNILDNCESIVMGRKKV